MFDYTKSILFRKINEPEIEKMLRCSMASTKQVDGGEMIFGQDDKPVFIYLLWAGYYNQVSSVRKKGYIDDSRAG